MRRPYPLPPDPIPALKRQLAAELRALFGNWNQYVVAHRLGIHQPEAWELLHDRLERFSLQKLIRLLARVERRVELRVEAESDAPLRLFLFPPRERPQATRPPHR